MQENDGDGGAVEMKETNSKVDVVGYIQERFVGDRTVRGESARPGLLLSCP